MAAAPSVAAPRAVPPPSVVVSDPVEQWGPQLSRLVDLGFTDITQYIPLLEEENGDLERVVNRIIRRQA